MRVEIWDNTELQFMLKKTLNLTFVSFSLQVLASDTSTSFLALCFPSLLSVCMSRLEISPHSMRLDCIHLPVLKATAPHVLQFYELEKIQKLQNAFNRRTQNQFYSRETSFQMASTTTNLQLEDIRHTSAKTMRSVFDTIK